MNKISESERRKDRRLLCSNLMQISWSKMNGHRQTEDGVLEDVSNSGYGLSVHLPTPLVRGTELSILLNGKASTGIVSQCTVRENGYLIGVRLDERCERFEGLDHLVDVTMLDLG